MKIMNEILRLKHLQSQQSFRDFSVSQLTVVSSPDSDLYSSLDRKLRCSRYARFSDRSNHRVIQVPSVLSAQYIQISDMKVHDIYRHLRLPPSHDSEQNVR